MSFGIFKSGANTTDKKLIRRFNNAGWSVDKMSNKLSITPEVIERIIAFQAGKKPVPVAPETQEEAVVRMLADDKDATDIAVELDVELDVIEAIIEGLPV